MTQPLTTRTIFRFYTPLAASWILMAIEAPIAIGVVSRLAEPTLNAAAQQLMFGLALWIESPIIDLLTTSTTLTKDRPSFVLISRFVWWLIGLVTVAHLLLALPAVFLPFATHPAMLNVPQHVADAALPAMALMIPWSAFIGWRRYRQGILIRFGHTRRVGAGTVVRITAMAGVGLSLMRFSSLPGVQIVAIALVSSVVAEALFAHVASRSVVAERLNRIDPAVPTLTWSTLLKFHLPLTATTMVMFVANPMVSAALARAPENVEAMAAYMVCLSLLFLTRTIVFALPEVLVALYKGPESLPPLRKACVIVGGTASAFLLFMVVTQLDRQYFLHIVGATSESADRAHWGMVAGAAMPALGAWHSYLRGMLTVHHITVARLYAVLANVVTMAVALALGVSIGLPGVVNASLSATAALLAEGVLLAWAWRRARENLLPPEAQTPSAT